MPLGSSPPPNPASSRLPPGLSPPAAGELEELATLPSVPSWLVSLVLHIALLLALALWPTLRGTGGTLTLQISTGESELGLDFSLTDPDSQDGELDAEDWLADAPALDVEPVTVPWDDPLTMPAVSLEVGSTPLEMAIRQGLSGRDGLTKELLLAAYGGTPGTERSVADGLQWLARQQLPDGGWSLLRPYSDGGTNENQLAATAMALLAFSGAGNTHQTGTYQREVRRGLTFLLKKQDAQGWMAAAGADRQQMYAQAMATIAICELLGMTQDYNLREPAQKAIGFAERAQSSLGGWRYVPGQDADVSVSGWFLMALISAKMAGLEVDPSVLERLDRYLDSVQHEGGALYGYRQGSPPSLSMTAEALLCRQYLGWSRDDSRMLRGAEAVLTATIDFSSRERSVYYWYYATQMLHHLGGRPWETWNAVMREALPAAQLQQGREAGSWDPSGDPHAIAGGRLYTTCLSLWCLQVYYRHLPLYDLATADRR